MHSITDLLASLAGIALALVFYPQNEKVFSEHEHRVLNDCFERLRGIALLQQLTLKMY